MTRKEELVRLIRLELRVEALEGKTDNNDLDYFFTDHWYDFPKEMFHGPGSKIGSGW